MDPEIDLVADLNAEDDEGLGWSVLSQARDPSRVRRGVMLVAGNGQAKAVVRIVAVDDDGQVHFCPARLAGEEPPPHRPRPGLAAAPPTWRVLTGLITISGPVTSVPTRGFGC